MNKFQSSNLLLTALPISEYQRLLPHCQLVLLTPGEIIYQSGEKIKYIYFLESGLISLITILESGATIEAARVGKEGLIGMPIILGNDFSINSAIVLIAGRAIRLEAEILQQEFQRGEQLQKLILLYIQIRLTQLMQNVACYGQHRIEQRLARLLLSIYDYLQQPEFTLTQEAIATILGVRRSGITVAASKLQQDKIIYYRRGKITILNPIELERVSCECYRVIKGEFKKLFTFNV
ncbi:hypothetical protein NIES4102_33850 [Chondrocystis sp. NIES-4102]|nr:hypothetical protein NIES4102_33850 [Chondrocystis sp. NIES-4102]